MYSLHGFFWLQGFCQTGEPEPLHLSRETVSHVGFALGRHQLKAFPGWGERQGPTLASDKDISLKGGTFPQGTSAVKEWPRHVDHEARASWSRTVCRMPPSTVHPTKSWLGIQRNRRPGPCHMAQRIFRKSRSGKSKSIEYKQSQHW